MNEHRLDHWQRLSPWAVVFLFVRGVVRFARENIPVLLGAGAGVAVIERIGMVEVVLAGSAALLAALLLSLLYYRRFRFCFDGDVLLVQKGLFERTELKVSAGRVQHVSLEQPAYMRPFGVVRFSADTPGGVTAELELPGIPSSVAEALRRALSTPDAGAPEAVTEQTDEAGPQRRELFRIRPGALTLHGLTSNSIYLVAALLAPVLQPVERLGRPYLENLEDAAWVERAGDAPVLVALAVLLTLLLVLMTAAVIVAWLRFYAFTLSRTGDRLVQSSGLFNRQEQELSGAKLQTVEWVQTALGRLLGLGYLVCRQYGGLPQAADHAGRNFLVPGLVQPRGGELVQEFWPGLALDAECSRVHRHYRRSVALRLVPVLSLVTVVMAGLSGRVDVLYGLVAVPVLAWVLGHLRWRAVGWRTDGPYVVVRRGLLGRRTVTFPLINVQAVEVRQSWFQRRRGLATLHLTPASGPEAIPWIPVEQALALANVTLYQVETRGADPAVD